MYYDETVKKNKVTRVFLWQKYCIFEEKRIGYDGFVKVEFNPVFHSCESPAFSGVISNGFRLEFTPVKTGAGVTILGFFTRLSGIEYIKSLC